MPYVITTTSEHIAEDSISTEVHVHFRHAVATFEEVLPITDALIEEHDGSIKEYVDPPDAGGTIGALPDGTTIEVTPTTFKRLLSELHHAMLPAPGFPATEAEIIEAYNAAQEAA